MSDFASSIIAWQVIYGRHDLPWQNTTDPYAIWVSEIMLQQTQVTAVIGYYRKFMQRFPNIASLANASQEEVLQYWSGLGYYSRARNLHHAALAIMDKYNGKFPQDFTTIQMLSGIGRSTAAAIASFAFNQVQTILDGNVKRVLARYFLVEGWTSSPRIEKELWLLAESLLPKQDMVAYTQGLMDLGATICTRSSPKCAICPINTNCEALNKQRLHDIPTSKPRKVLPEKHTIMVILRCGDEVLLEKRASTGIWGGLWSFPEVDVNHEVGKMLLNRFGFVAKLEMTLPIFTHVFSHFKLHIQPQIFLIENNVEEVTESGRLWLNINDAIGAAIPSPVRKILQSMQMHLPL